MDDARIWGSEEGLWKASADHYSEIISEDCLMVLPDHPNIFTGAEAVDAVSKTPRWPTTTFTDRRVSRPQEGLIVIAYTVTAGRDEESYSAHCTTTYRRLAPDEWRVIQHQQSPVLEVVAG